MATTKNGMGIARIALSGLAVLLLTGVIGSFVMGIRDRNAAVRDAVTQAKAVADSSLTLVFRPEDASPSPRTPAPTICPARSARWSSTRSFDTVTLWSTDAEILYATDQGRIGNRLDGERDAIRTALRGEPQTEIDGGVLSIMVPLRFESGVGEPAVVELTTSADPVAAAAAPWRTNAIFIGVALLIVVALLLWARAAASASPTHGPSSSG